MSVTFSLDDNLLIAPYIYVCVYKILYFDNKISNSKGSLQKKNIGEKALNAILTGRALIFLKKFPVINGQPHLNSDHNLMLLI